MSEDYIILKEFLKYGIKAIYTNKDYGNVQEKEIRNKVIPLGKEMAYGHQKHTSNVINLDENRANFHENTDGFVSSRKDIVIFTQYADCLPIYFYDIEKQVIGLSHSGWQGTYDEIGKNTLNIFKNEFKSSLENILIGFGVSISQENYEVSQEFYNKFLKKFTKYQLEKVFLEKDGKIFFDNQQLNYNLMLSYGIKEENIFKNNLCTYRDNFHSYRRDKDKAGRNGGYIFFL